MPLSLNSSKPREAWTATGQMAGSKFVGFAYIQDNIRFADGLFGLVQGDFLDERLCGGHQIMGSLHG